MRTKVAEGAELVAIAKEIAAEVRRGKTDRSRRKISSLLARVGRRKLDRPTLIALERALSTEGVYCTPSLSEDGMGRNSWTLLSPEQPTGQFQVQEERQIVAIAEGLVGKPGPFFNYRAPRTGRGPTEVILRNGCKVDMLLRSVHNGSVNEWVVFEFKKSEGGMAALEQLLRYLRELEAEGYAPLRGIVVANDRPEIERRSSPAANSRWPIEWWVFTPKFDKQHQW